jgi:parallel beta-helix repeat protein
MSFYLHSHAKYDTGNFVHLNHAIMKTLAKLATSILLVVTYLLVMATSIAGQDSILINTTWNIDTVKVNCDIVIDSAATLTIMPGTVIEFHGEYMIDVQGALLAKGTKYGPVLFTVSDTSGLYKNELIRWKNINFTNVADTNKASLLKYCILEYNMHNAVNVSQFNNLTVSDCLIRYGTNKGIYVYKSNITVQNCKINNNQVGMSMNYSGGYLFNNVISNNTFIGIYLNCSSPEIINNTICNNNSGLACFNVTHPVIINSIFWSNSDIQITIHKSAGISLISYCDIEGGRENIDLGEKIDVYENNIDMNPYFNDTSAMDYSLSDSSVCINKGIPDTTGLNILHTDITGNPRIIGDTIDIGAYEFPLNFAPSDILLSNAEIDENIISGSFVGSFSTIDVNAEDTHTYSFDTGDGTNDADNSSFIISDDSLKTGTCPDHEEKDSYRIYVKSTDNGYNNLSCSRAFIINILDINEPPIINLQTFSVDENSLEGTVVDTVKAYDPDKGQTLSWSIISGNIGDAFIVDPYAGEIKVNNPSALDYETTPTFGLIMQVQDDGPGSLTAEGLITINLNDIYEPVGLNAVTPGMFRLYPNPVKKVIYFEFPGDDLKNLTIEMKSVNGNFVYLKEMNELSGKIKARINVSDIPEGLYLIIIRNNRILITRKIEVIR